MKGYKSKYGEDLLTRDAAVREILGDMAQGLNMTTTAMYELYMRDDRETVEAVDIELDNMRVEE